MQRLRVRSKRADSVAEQLVRANSTSGVAVIPLLYPSSQFERTVLCILEELYSQTDVQKVAVLSTMYKDSRFYMECFLGSFPRSSAIKCLDKETIVATTPAGFERTFWFLPMSSQSLMSTHADVVVLSIRPRQGVAARLRECLKSCRDTRVLGVTDHSDVRATIQNDDKGNKAEDALDVLREYGIPMLEFKTNGAYTRL